VCCAFFPFLPLVYADYCLAVPHFSSSIEEQANKAYESLTGEQSSNNSKGKGVDRSSNRSSIEGKGDNSDDSDSDDDDKGGDGGGDDSEDSEGSPRKIEPHNVALHEYAYLPEGGLGLERLCLPSNAFHFANRAQAIFCLDDDWPYPDKHGQKFTVRFVCAIPLCECIG
jgi:hypothetical protein